MTKYSLPVYAWALIILILCIIPIPTVESIQHLDWLPVPIDKIVHFSFYFILAALIIRWFHFQAISRTVVAFSSVITMVITLAYGMLIEFIQLHIPYRSGDWNDVAVNTLGSAIAILLMRNFFRQTAKSKD